MTTCMMCRGDDVSLAIERHYLIDYEPLARWCKECSTLFVANRRNQEFCRITCLGRMTQRRFRTHKAEQEATTV